MIRRLYRLAIASGVVFSYGVAIASPAILQLSANAQMEFNTTGPVSRYYTEPDDAGLTEKQLIEIQKIRRPLDSRETAQFRRGLANANPEKTVNRDDGSQVHFYRISSNKKYKVKLIDKTQGVPYEINYPANQMMIGFQYDRNGNYMNKRTLSLFNGSGGSYNNDQDPAMNPDNPIIEGAARFARRGGIARSVAQAYGSVAQNLDRFNRDMQRRAIEEGQNGISNRVQQWWNRRSNSRYGNVSYAQPQSTGYSSVVSNAEMDRYSQPQSNRLQYNSQSNNSRRFFSYRGKSYRRIW